MVVAHSFSCFSFLHPPPIPYHSFFLLSFLSLPFFALSLFFTSSPPLPTSLSLSDYVYLSRFFCISPFNLPSLSVSPFITSCLSSAPLFAPPPPFPFVATLHCTAEPQEEGLSVTVCHAPLLLATTRLWPILPSFSFGGHVPYNRKKNYPITGSRKSFIREGALKSRTKECPMFRLDNVSNGFSAWPKTHNKPPPEYESEAIFKKKLKK